MLTTREATDDVMVAAIVKRDVQVSCLIGGWRISRMKIRVSGVAGLQAQGLSSCQQSKRFSDGFRMLNAYVNIGAISAL